MYKYLIFILSVFIFCSCDNINGSGRIKTEKRNIEHFDGVQASGSMDIEVADDKNVAVDHREYKTDKQSEF